MNSTQKELFVAGVITVAILGIFLWIQRLGLVNLVSGGTLGYGAVFLIGVIASLSTCMAVVGGFLLSMSATFAKGGDRVVPQVLFHVGRFVSFLVLGGVIGVLGQAFTLSTTISFVLNFGIGVVMLILGVKLLDIVPWARYVRITFPRFFKTKVEGMTRMNHTLTPFLVGVATFFMPCGFTQSMQLYTLGTGDFVSGALTMFVFALGTFPVLALVSFSSFGVTEGKYAGVFYKTAGLIVVAFALMNIINSFVIIGVIAPVFTF